MPRCLPMSPMPLPCKTDRLLRRRLRPERAAGGAGAGVHRAPRAARRRGRERAAAQRARPRAGARHRLADRRAGARQLGDGRLRAARRRPGGRRATPCCAVAGTGLAGQAFAGAVPARPLRAHHDRRGDAGRASTPSCRRNSPRVDGDARRRIPAGVVRSRRQPPPGRRGPGARRGGAARRPHAAPGRPGPAGLARPGRGAGAAAGCASPSSPPATSCARSASRSTPAASTTATATRSGACCSAWASRSSTSASCATTRPRCEPRSAARRRAPTRSSPRAASASAKPTTPRSHGRLGDVLFWRIAMRPGPADGDRPHRRRPILFGLPGNPVAVMVTFYAFVRDALLRDGRRAPTSRCRCCARACTTPMRKKPGRTEYQRGIVTPRRRRPLAGRDHRRQGSGILRSMSVANGLVRAAPRAGQRRRRRRGRRAAVRRPDLSAEPAGLRRWPNRLARRAVTRRATMPMMAVPQPEETNHGSCHQLPAHTAFRWAPRRRQRCRGKQAPSLRSR